MTTTRRAACVIGWPVEHSRSPLIHNYWLKRYGIAGEYRREPVRKEEFAAFIGTLAARGYVGANVTVPHKEAAFALSQPDERARAVGAVNTLWLDGAVLRSTNTDVEGFLDNLDACAPHWDRDAAKALVLGAGGAARAVVLWSAVARRGADRRRQSHRQPRRSAAAKPSARACRSPIGRGWSGNLRIRRSSSTPRRSACTDSRRSRSIWRRLGRHAIVADIVYVPVVTPLLAAAKARGLATADGLGMLLHQAVRGFSLWFGKMPEVTGELRALVEADLDAT